jgi:hypothetical protein
MVHDMILSTGEKGLFELSTPEHVRVGVGDNECSEMVTCGLQADSFSQATGDDAVKDVAGSPYIVNLQHTSLCSTTFTNVNNTYSVINHNVFFFRAFVNERSGSFRNFLHTIVIHPQTLFVTCLNLVLGPSAIYSPWHMFLTE